MDKEPTVVHECDSETECELKLEQALRGEDIDAGIELSDEG